VFISGRLNYKAFRLAGNMARKGEMTAAYSVLAGKSEGKRTFARRSGMWNFFFLALQPPLGLVFYSPLAGFSLLPYEVS